MICRVLFQNPGPQHPFQLHKYRHFLVIKSKKHGFLISTTITFGKEDLRSKLLAYCPTDPSSSLTSDRNTSAMPAFSTGSRDESRGSVRRTEMECSFGCWSFTFLIDKPVTFNELTNFKSEILALIHNML